MSLFETLDVSGWVRAQEQRTQVLQRFDQRVAALRTAVKQREGTGIPAPATPIAVSPAKVAFHGPEGSEELAGELGVSADAWVPANEALTQAVATRERAERTLAAAVAQQQSRVRYILVALFVFLLYLRTR